MPSKKRKFNARFPAGRIKKIMRIDDDIGKVALPVPVMISRALELFVSSLLVKAGGITIQKNARTLTLTHLKQCINSDDRLDFLKDLLKDIPEITEEANEMNRPDSPVNKKRRITDDDDESEEEVFSLDPPPFYDVDGDVEFADDFFDEIDDGGHGDDDDCVDRSGGGGHGDDDDCVDLGGDGGHGNDDDCVDHGDGGGGHGGDDDSVDLGGGGGGHGDDDDCVDHGDERLNTAAVQKAIKLSLFVEDGDSGDGIRETIKSPLSTKERTRVKVEQETIESPMFIGEGTSTEVIQETVKPPLFMGEGTRAESMQAPMIMRNTPRIRAMRRNLDPPTYPEGAPIESAELQKEIAELEALQETIKAHLIITCECWGASPVSVKEMFRRYGRTMPPESQNVNVVAEYLSTVRMMLSKNRLQVINSRCPEMTNACNALISNIKWRQKILAILSAKNDYLRYKAMCTINEILLHFTYDHDETPARLYYNIAQMILNEAYRNARIATLQTLTMMLRTHDHDQLAPYTKSIMLHHLQKYWKSIVNKITCCRDRSLLELLALWDAVFAALREPKIMRAVDEHLVHSYTSGLSKVESVLHAEDTHPLVWMRTIRVLSAALTSRTGATPRCKLLLALAQTYLIGFHRNRLLRTLHHIKDRFAWPDNQTMGLQDVLLLTMRSMRVYVRNCESRTKAVAMVLYTVERIELYVKSCRMYNADMPFSRWLVHMMYNRDDVLVECLLTAVDIVQRLPVTRLLLDPFWSFLELALRGAYNPDLFFDYLISDETDFLSYILKLLKVILDNSQRFFLCCGNNLPRIMELLTVLRTKIRLHHFPYKIEPVAKLIDNCVTLHEKFELPTTRFTIDH